LRQRAPADAGETKEKRTWIIRKSFHRLRPLQPARRSSSRKKAFTRARDALARKRRELPWTRVEKSYVFESSAGPKSLADLFAGRGQLIVQHFMFAPDWEQGCVGCSSVRIMSTGRSRM
jgi:predicted dithiol-disulfide oxidoreductase (DUF899 family)